MTADDVDLKPKRFATNEFPEPSGLRDRSAGSQHFSQPVPATCRRYAALGALEFVILTDCR
jgi:hypothetical protein